MLNSSFFTFFKRRIDLPTATFGMPMETAIFLFNFLYFLFTGYKQYGYGRRMCYIHLFFRNISGSTLQEQKYRLYVHIAPMYHWAVRKKHFQIIYILSYSPVSFCLVCLQTWYITWKYIHVIFGIKLMLSIGVLLGSVEYMEVVLAMAVLYVEGEAEAIQ